MTALDPRVVQFKGQSGVVALEFLMVLPLLVGLLYAGLVYGVLFFHKLEMQRAVDIAATAVFSLDRRQHAEFGSNAVAHSQSALGGLSAQLPARIRNHIIKEECLDRSEGGVEMLVCELTVSSSEPFLPQLNLGYLGSFPPQPSELSVKAAVAF
ncbi:TadE/TadG family type IV pilus assembly protein [Marinobacter sp. UBA3607]|jgi:hypothetical protein|uniref:TadE/TadG family type IV pilus assembly protein n=1 Tax=Marinobacter sp. UBA3607 TaxID=1946820 RepID=UPI002580EC0C|nr:TadE/TadG family type IV pilus assembly protein [Marinobacter sp. UBA3607]|tara:strand:+ start:223 stop:684 length:462 start_codon:yes stop_codon:yes gene_type:complete